MACFHRSIQPDLTRKSSKPRLLGSWVVSTGRFSHPTQRIHPPLRRCQRSLQEELSKMADACDAYNEQSASRPFPAPATHVVSTKSWMEPQSNGWNLILLKLFLSIQYGWFIFDKSCLILDDLRVSCFVLLNLYLPPLSADISHTTPHVLAQEKHPKFADVRLPMANTTVHDGLYWLILVNSGQSWRTAKC